MCDIDEKYKIKFYFPKKKFIVPMSKKLLVSKTILINLFKIKFDYFNPTIYKYQQTTITMSCEICDRNQYHQNDLHCSNGLIGPKIKEWFD